MSKILIIDDDSYVRTSLQVRLEKEDFQVFTAENGAQGICVAEHENPNLIVLDLVMPDLDGLDVLDYLRSSMVTWDTPVVVLTARGDSESLKRTRQLGASCFLRKPFSPRCVVSEISRVLHGAGI